MMTFRKYITLSLVLLCCVPAFSQKDNRRLIRQGNSLYLDSLFNDAETSYRKAIKKNDKDATAHFNLGNALLRQRNPKDAAAQYESAIKRTKNPLYLAKANHNLGVILQSQKQYGEAIKVTRMLCAIILTTMKAVTILLFAATF